MQSTLRALLLSRGFRSIAEVLQSTLRNFSDLSFCLQNIHPFYNSPFNRDPCGATFSDLFNYKINDVECDKLLVRDCSLHCDQILVAMVFNSDAYCTPVVSLANPPSYMDVELLY